MYDETKDGYNYGSASNETQSNSTINEQADVSSNQNGQQYFYYSAGNTQQSTTNYSQPQKNQKIKKTKAGIGFAKRAIICLSLGIIFGLAAGCAFAVPTYLSHVASSKLATTQATTSNAQASNTTSLETTTGSIANTTTTASNNSASDATVETIASNCLPSVVSITNKGVAEVRTMFGNMQQEYESSGSGIIIGKNDSELLIVTNNHVVSGNNELSVVFSYSEDSDDPVVAEAKLKGYDSEKDLAVIAVSLNDISEDTMSKIKIATVGDSSSLQLGQEVVAIGNALGYGQSVTTGIISALNREVSVSDHNGSTITNKLIQTDAAINPGNSGGALLNMKGELIGINSVKVASSEVEGMGYAIPISDVNDIINDLMNKETRDVVDSDEQGYIGIAGTDVSSEISSTYDLPMGVYVNIIYDNSPAAAAGIQKGYIITKFDGSNVRSMAELKELLTHYKVGETVEVKCQVQGSNGYEEKSFSLTLGTKESLPTSTENSKDSEQSDQNEQNQEPSQNNGNYFWPFSNQW